MEAAKFGHDYGSAHIKPALIRFGAEIEAILKQCPAAGPLFPHYQRFLARGILKSKHYLWHQNTITMREHFR